MERELRDRWVAALRSGEYRQIRGKACSQSGKSHCCLDVLRVLIGLPQDITEEGLWREPVTATMLALVPCKVQYQLADLNDSQKRNFNQIAGWIEENIPVDEVPQ